MKWNRTKIFSVFLTLVMLGSLVGTTVYFSSTQGNNQDQQDENTNITRDIKGFKASGTQVTVTQFLPGLAFQANTSISDITAIEAKIRASPYFQDFFESNYVGTNPLVYFALVRINSLDNLEDAKADLRERLADDFTNLGFFHYGSIVPNESVVFEENNGDDIRSLNLTYMEAFIYEATKIDTTIEVECNVLIDVASDELSRLVCFELRGTTGGFNIINFESKATITDLNNIYTFNHDYNYTEDFDRVALQTDFEASSIIDSVEFVSDQEPEPKLVASASLEDQVVVQLLDQAVSSLSFVESTDPVFDNNQLSMTIVFDRSATLGDVVDGVQTVFDDQNIIVVLNDSFTRKSVDIRVYYAEGVGAIEAAIEIRGVLDDHDLNPLIARLGVVDLDPNAEFDGKSYFVRGYKGVPLLLDPRRIIGDKIDVTFVGIVSDDIVNSIAVVRDKFVTQALESN